jgi:hypothetical protein
MTKKQGFKVTIVAFVEIDKKDFGKQAKAFETMDAITKTGKVPADFLTSATILSINAKQGGADVPDAAKGDEFDPATWPLTTEPLPEGATVLAATTMLDTSIFQTVRLVDGTETSRRISAEQDAAETGKIAPQVDDGKAAEIKAGKK